MAQLVEALRYKPEGRGFNYQWCHGRGLKVDLASNRNEYKEYFLGAKGVGLTTLPPTFLCQLPRNLEASTSWNTRVL